MDYVQNYPHLSGKRKSVPDLNLNLQAKSGSTYVWWNLQKKSDLTYVW